MDLGFSRSKSEARQLISQNAVRVDGVIVANPAFEFEGAEHRVIEVGKNRIAENLDFLAQGVDRENDLR